MTIQSFLLVLFGLFLFISCFSDSQLLPLLHFLYLLLLQSINGGRVFQFVQSFGQLRLFLQNQSLLLLAIFLSELTPLELYLLFLVLSSHRLHETFFVHLPLKLVFVFWATIRSPISCSLIGQSVNLSFLKLFSDTSFDLLSFFNPSAL